MKTKVRRHLRKTRKKIAIVRRHHRRKSYSSIRMKLTPEQLEEFTKNIKKDDVIIAGIGKFKIKKVAARPARKGINPFTKKEQMFKAKPASQKLKFFPSKNLKEAL